MFDFFSMADNYEQRKVDHTDLSNGAWVDTAAVNDAEQPYETAIEHPRYNGGKMVIVELYDTKKAAQSGHDRWVAAMTAETLPTFLRDVSSTGMASLIDIFGGDEWREKGLDAPEN